MPEVEAKRPPQSFQDRHVGVAEACPIKVDDGHAMEIVLAQRAGKPPRFPVPLGHLPRQSVKLIVIIGQATAALDQHDRSFLSAYEPGVPGSPAEQCGERRHPHHRSPYREPHVGHTHGLDLKGIDWQLTSV
jgi:hypothetical protein